VRFSLQDIKKQVQRRGNTLTVSLHFLRSGELREEIEHLVSYHEHLLGQAQRDFSIDDARACIGDYRLAHCLITTLSPWYHWQQRDWQMVVKQSGNDILERFMEANIASPVQLRLALFNFVNQRFDGFLDAQMRSAALEEFTGIYCGMDQQGKPALAVPDLEYVLALDSDEEAVLVRDTPHPPDADEVASLYNQWVFEAALFNASDVHFVINCAAFLKMQDTGTNNTMTGVGAVIKRLCYLSRKLGVYYDLAYDSDSLAGQTSPSILHLTLYGPQDMTGAPQQYGLRLAKLCRILLGYSTPNHLRNNPRHDPRRGGSGVDEGMGRLRRPGPTSPTTLPTSAILQAEATIHFLQRAYRFVMDTRLLNLLPSPSVTSTIETRAPSTVSSTSSDEQTRNQQVREVSQPYNVTSTIYDSSIEQSFAEAFHSLASSDGADGWQLEREPEPLLLDHPSTETAVSTLSYGIFIPDFALTRDNQRIYVEILGYWTPAYRERKIAKLQLLKDRNDLVLAIPREASEAFASISNEFPIVFYHNQLSATELLNVLRLRYDDVSVRLSQIDVEDVRRRIQSESLLPEHACYSLLHCYRRSELIQAAGRIIGEGITFTSGIGFYEIDSLEQLRGSFVEWLEESLREAELSATEVAEKKLKKSLPLDRVLHESRARWPILATCEDAAIEAIISLWPEVHIGRSSIFEATISLFDGEETSLPQVEAPRKKSIRTQRTTEKKRIIQESKQADLWS
jgi:predicted nuclease of restriction endonuclease-like RecB superfamily